ncbi:MAG TPA: glycosyltransferase family 1 protein [Anaeromyxobacteraceae bacterium]|nr:glycosyltransferase family 1 protein [Anaeromyxobacteraceae bacterium]
MRIALSLLALRPGQVGGAETYVRALVRHLPAAAAGDELLLVLDRDLDRTIEAPGWTKVVMPYGARELVARRIAEAYAPWRDRRSEAVLAAARPDVTLHPQQSIFPREPPGAAVLTVVDVQHLHHPENFGLFDRTFRPRVYPRSLARADRVIAISEFTLRTLAGRCALSPGKGVVIPLGVDPAPPGTGPPLPVGLAPDRFLYCPAATWPHKGHDRLIAAYGALRRGGRVTDRLVLTGQRTPLWKRELQPLARRLGIEGDVLHLGFVPRPTVDALLSMARAVVFPTRYEGFGLPVVEAANAGGRIVASRLEVFDEIGLPRENQVDFEDPESVAAALALPRPTRLLREPLSWAEVARRTAEVLRATGSGPGWPR